MPMEDALTLSQSKLTTFLTCQRRFYLRYRARLPWPEPPLPAEQEAALALGQQFHQLLERHFLGLPVEEALGENGRLRHWWSQFQNQPPDLPSGKRLPEVSLTVPLVSAASGQDSVTSGQDSVTSGQDSGFGGRAPLLVGRFDLVVLAETPAGQPAVHIYDWKTGRPQPLAELRRSWQTKLYLALAAAGGGSLFSLTGEQDSKKLKVDRGQLAPERVRLTYWYVNAPDEPRTIGYGRAAHEQNWAELTAVAAQIAAGIAEETAVFAPTMTGLPDTLWPKTEAWSHCAFCAYQAYCGRQGAVAAATPPPVAEFEPDLDETTVWELEPGAR
jgi:hypothetical protein